MEFPIVLVSVATIWLIAVVTPGPNFFITVRTAVAQSRLAAFFVALGTSSGAIIWGLCGYFGIALLFQTAPWVYATLKLIGGAYLIYLGVRLILTNTQAEANQQGPIPTHTHFIQSYKLGLFTNLANPKTAAFVSSLFAATMPSHAPFSLGIMSVALMCLISILWYACVAYIFSMAHFKRLYLRGKTWIERFAGAIFIGFGLKLVYSR